MAMKGAGSVEGYLRRIMYRATLGWRWGVRRERSVANEEVEGSRTVRGVRDSEVMVQRRPNWEGVETRVWNAVWSSWEAGRRGWLVVKQIEEGSDERYLIFRTAF